MKLYDICGEIALIEEGLISGEVSFSFDKLASAMMPGHPADMLDDILSEIGFDVYKGEEISLDRVIKMKKHLDMFQKELSIKELKKPIKDLTEYIKQNSVADDK